jgi:hypothetical protein
MEIVQNRSGEIEMARYLSGEVGDSLKSEGFEVVEIV